MTPTLIARTRRGHIYGVRFMPVAWHWSVGISVVAWPVWEADVTLHLPFGVLVVGMVG